MFGPAVNKDRPRACEVLAEFGVQFARAAQAQHVAKHGDAPSAGPGFAAASSSKAARIDVDWRCSFRRSR